MDLYTENRTAINQRQMTRVLFCSFWLFPANSTVLILDFVVVGIISISIDVNCSLIP